MKIRATAMAQFQQDDALDAFIVVININYNWSLKLAHGEASNKSCQPEYKRWTEFKQNIWNAHRSNLM